MAQNKKSIWSTIILVCTILTLVILVATIVVTTVGIPAALEQAKQAAAGQGLSPEEIELAASVAIGAIVVALVLASILEIFEVIGGFLFSLKGRWGIFCIVISILSSVSSLYSVISSITQKSSALTITFGFLGLAVNILFCVACFKHYQENKQ